MIHITKQNFHKLKSKLGPYVLHSPLGPLFDLIETKTGIEPAILTIAFLGILSIYLVIGWCNDFVCNFIGLPYPIYASLMAVRSAETDNDKQLLTYWIVYSSFGSIEYVLHSFFDFLIFYWLGKCIFLLWFFQSGSSLAKMISDVQNIIVSKQKSSGSLSMQRKMSDPKRTQSSVPPRSAILSRDAQWIQNGVIVAGGNENGCELYQLWRPSSICIDDDQNVFVVDQANNRIVKWKPGATEGSIVVGSNGSGSSENQLSSPNDVLIDKQADSFIISDSGNKRIVRWAPTGGTVGETIISNIDCKGLTIDENGSIYVTDNEKHAIRRYDIGGTEGTIVAGGNGAGDRLDQLDNPASVFVDQNYSVYVSDENNHRVTKWEDGSIQGIVVAGGHGQGSSLSQLNFPQGIIVDQSGTVYVADHLNDRVMRWFKGATEGEVVVGNNGSGAETNQVSHPNGLAFDTKGNLYVVEWDNARVQRFNITSNS